MKSLLFLLAVLSLSAGAEPGPDAPPFLRDGDNVVLIGDSITDQGCRNPWGFYHLLTNAAAKVASEGGAKVNFLPLGYSGYQVKSWSDMERNSVTNDVWTWHVTPKLNIRTVLDGKVDAIVIFLGMNDILQPSIRDTDADLAKWTADYRAFVADLRNRCHPRRFVFATITPLTADPLSPKNQVRMKLNQRLAALAAEMEDAVWCDYGARIAFLQAAKRFVDARARPVPDFVHPRQEGHQLIAEELALRGLGDQRLFRSLRDLSKVSVFEGPEACNLWVRPVRTNRATDGEFLYELQFHRHAGRSAEGLQDREQGPRFPSIRVIVPDGWSVDQPEDFFDGTFRRIVRGRPEKALNPVTVVLESADGKVSRTTVGIPAPWRLQEDGGEWKAYTATDDYTGGTTPGSIDPYQCFFGWKSNRLKAARRVWSEKERDVKAVLSHQGFSETLDLAVTLDGREVWSDKLDRGGRNRIERTLHLKKGWNALEIACVHYDWQRQFAFDLEPLEGDDLSALKYDLGPSGQVAGGAVSDFNGGWTVRREGGAETSVTLPHDAAIAGPFDPALENCTGLLPYFGHVIYRKRFDARLAPTESRFLEFDGVMSCAKVFVNGRLAAERPYGYASFSVPLDAFLKDGENEVVVDVNPPRKSARWYPGLGIYRDVRLVTVDRRAHVAYGGIRVRTDGNRAVVDVELEGAEAKDASWEAHIVGETGLEVAAPRLWSPETPNLYEVEVTVRLNGAVTDLRRVRFGFRTLRYDVTEGFFLNGVHRQMRGVCLHHDLGSLGAAFDAGAARRQLSILKEMGCDAIRTSHNPPAPGLLDLCDEMGLMVMDEAFDMWEAYKTEMDYARFFKAWHERDLTDFIRRDRNHPCVVMWSVGNEVIEHSKSSLGRGSVADGLRIGRRLTDIVHGLDDRPVTSGYWNRQALTNGMAGVIDVFGANYLPEDYASFRGRQGVIGSETCSMVSSRGEYFFPLGTHFLNQTERVRRRDGFVNHQVSGYDIFPLRTNNCPPDWEFRHQEENPHVFGEFVWTGFDYLGETDPWGEKGSPARSSYYGIVDLCGFPKDRYYCYQAHWRPDLPMAHILPHWTWPGREGEVTPVHVYSSGDEAELFVNGRSQGVRTKGRGAYRFVWEDVVYAPGELKVVVRKGGAPWAEETVRTAGAPVAVKAERRTWGDLDYWTFTATDRDGNFAPTGALRLRFAVEDGELAGVGNGDPTDHDSLKGETIRTFHGLAQAIVRRRPGVEPKLTWRTDECRASSVYVDAAAPAGGTGAKERPFRSPVEAVRSLRGKPHDGSTILLAPGTYELPNGLSLTKEDHDIVFSKTPGEGVVRFTRSIAATPGGKVDCSAPPAPDTENFHAVRPRAPLFFYDHAWAVPARWPNEGWAYFTTAVDNGLRSRIRGGIAPDKPAVAGSFVFDSDRPAKWNFDEGVWLAGYFTHDWAFERLRAESFVVTPSNRVMKMAGVAEYGLASGTWSSEKGRRFYAYNVRAELDAPGEVYWDRRTGVVDFIPPKDGVTEFRAAVTGGPIVSANGASGIVFDGLAFEYAVGDGLSFANCTNCSVVGCQVRNVGGNGVTIRGGFACRVRDSSIEGCGLGGVDVSGGRRWTLTPCKHEIAGCDISRFGMLQRTYAPGARVGGVGVHLVRNKFHEAPHSAVLYGGNDHLFEHNEVYGIMRETGDAGAFYSGRDPLSRGNVLRFNYVHDLGRPGDSAANTMAFYLDDCDAGDTLVSNRVKNVARGLMLGGGHDNHIVGNTFENCAIGMSVDARGVKWKDRWDSPIDRSWQMSRKVKEMQVDREPWRTRYPLLLTYLEDGPREPRHISIVGNVFDRCKRTLVFENGAKEYESVMDIRDNVTRNCP